MFENRPLTPAEGVLRHQSGSTDLVEHADEWYVLNSGSGARLTLGSAFVTMAGPDLLAHLESFGTSGGKLEFALQLADRFGAVHNAVGAAVYTVETAAEWRLGEHHGTTMDPDAGVLPDGSRRAGIRGADLMAGEPAPTGIYWISRPISFRNGREVERLVWDADDLRTPAGDQKGAYKINVRLGQDTGGTMTWRPWQTITDAAAPARRAYDFTGTLPAADAIQWRVDFQYGPGGAGYAEARLRTPTMFLAGVWVRLASQQFRFDSVGDLLIRADERILLQSKGWNGTDDLVTVRLSLGVPIKALPTEDIRVRFTPTAGMPLTYARVHCAGGLIFDEQG